MLMMCWFYCVPFAKGMFFAFSPLLIVFSLFVLKRGVRQLRPGLRLLAFFMIFFSFLKMLTIDIYLLRDKILCGVGWSFLCNGIAFKAFQLFGLAALVGVSVLLLNAYRRFVRERQQLIITPKQARLDLWARLSMAMVMLMTLWLAAPWVGYLTVGRVPQLFMSVPWQLLATINIVVLLTGFWKLEDCYWSYHNIAAQRKKGTPHAWTPRDTLWLSVTLFLITFALSYVSNDVLTSHHPPEEVRISP